jgi:DHA1 family multidrug resistance protein-like MFS transporter
LVAIESTTAAQSQPSVMDPVDKYVSNAERDASPRRFRSNPSDPEKGLVEEHEPITRIDTNSSSSSSSISSVGERNDAMSRQATQHEDIIDIERHPTALSRIQTQRSQHSNTVGATLKSRASRKPLPGFGAGKPYPPALPEREEYVVEFDGPDDPMHAMNWSLKKKILTAAMLGFTTLTAAFGSSIFSAATRVVANQFDVGVTVGVLGTSLYVLGFATGPILWAPFSELKGRRLPLVIASFGFSIFNVAVATGKDLQTVLICRFFSGFFGACPLTVS